MSATVQTIRIANLLLMALPLAVVVSVIFRWSLNGWSALYSIGRMLLQLLLVGYVLVYIFEAENALIIVAVLCAMLLIAAAISLHPLKNRYRYVYPHVVLSMAVGCLLMLVLVTQYVLELEPWFRPQFMVPIAGMIFANAMNSVSLAAERFTSEMAGGAAYREARQRALHVALIPLVNSMFAVGLVSLPGMMTGQILSGISPLIAARYQIMVMCMVFGSSGISVICYLLLAKHCGFCSFCNSRAS